MRFWFRTSLIGLLLSSLALTAFGAESKPIGKKIELKASDIFGKELGKDHFLGNVTVVSFVVRSTEDKATEIGQQIGATYGRNPGFQNLELINTSGLPFFMKPFADSFIERSFEKSLKIAVERQKENGLKSVDPQKVKERIIFVHDTTGKLWQEFGLSPDSEAYYVGVVNKQGVLVFLEKDPKLEALSDVLKREFR